MRPTGVAPAIARAIADRVRRDAIERRPRHVLEREQRIAAPRRDVFDFFSDPANLARLTPGGLNFRIFSTPPVRLETGSRLEYRIRWTVLRLRWVTRITRWVPDSEFEDVQEEGPYRTWIHTHRFEDEGDHVVMRDRVEYDLPFGSLGRLAHRLLVRRQLQAIFDFRSRAIEEVFPER